MSKVCPRVCSLTYHSREQPHFIFLRCPQFIIQTLRIYTPLLELFGLLCELIHRSYSCVYTRGTSVPFRLTMHTLGSILSTLALLSVCNTFLHDYVKANKSSLSIYSNSPDSFPGFSSSVLLPTRNVAFPIDPPNNAEICTRICCGIQLIDAMQLAAFKNHTNSPIPLGIWNKPSILDTFRSITAYWTTYTRTLGCNDLDHLNSVLQAFDAEILPVNDNSFRTWTLRVEFAPPNAILILTVQVSL